jgi:enoyl-[acyl-carrier-protein] reductase (NADH)
MTERQLDMWVTPEAMQVNLDQQCTKQPLVPAEVSRMVIFLTADDSSGCTSHIYFVDGGRAGN